MESDFYKLLGVSRNASPQEIKKAYRALARKYHPDANQGDPESEEMFKAISVAYEVLSDPEKKARYDQFGVDGLRGSSGFGGQGGGSFDFNISDLFEAFFGGASPFTTQAQGTSDAQVQVDVTLSDACFGATKILELNLNRPCEACNGTGAKPPSLPTTCETCAGAGAVQQLSQTFFGQMMTTSACPTCYGMGSIIEDPCQQCQGNGVYAQSHTLEITVPAGVETGSRLRLAGQGPAGPRGTSNGDLYVAINVINDERFVRQGDDLIKTQPISILQAMFGTEIECETLDGNEILHIEPGTQTNEVFKLKGRGMGRLRGRGRGDLLVYIYVEIPSAKNMSEEERKALENYADIIGEEIKEPQGASSIFEKVKRAFG